MKCSEFLQELTNYLDGVLDDRTKAELEDHLAWCHNCYVVCDTTKKTIEIYRDSQLYELPDDLRTACAPPSWRSASKEKRPRRAFSNTSPSPLPAKIKVTCMQKFSFVRLSDRGSFAGKSNLFSGIRI